MYSGDFQTIVRSHIQEAQSCLHRRVTVRVEQEEDLRAFQLDRRNVNQVAPDQQFFAVVREAITCMSWGVARQRDGRDPWKNVAVT